MLDNHKEEKLDVKFLQSYCHTQWGIFFVSTCYRRSSALVDPPPWYYETLAWKMGEENGWPLTKQEQVADNSGAFAPEQAIMQHTDVCRQLLFNGKFEELP